MGFWSKVGENWSTPTSLPILDPSKVGKKWVWGVRKWEKMGQNLLLYPLLTHWGDIDKNHV